MTRWHEGFDLGGRSELAATMRYLSWYVSAFGPTVHHSGFARSAARGQHFGDVHVTAEADEVVAALQVAGPTAKSGIVAKGDIALQRGGKLRIVAKIGSRLPQHRLVARMALGPIA